MFSKVVDFITNQDTGTQKIFERGDQNSERSVTLILVTDKVTSNTVEITNTEHLPRIYGSRFGESHRKL